MAPHQLPGAPYAAEVDAIARPLCRSKRYRFKTRAFSLAGSIINGLRKTVTQQMPGTRRLLVIAYHFPPVKVSSGIQRTLKFCSYLRDYGWEPLVLTISPRAYDLTSPEQLGEIPEGTVVERAFGLDTSRHLSIGGRYLRWMARPDRWVSWWPGGVWTGMRMIRRYKPAAIFSTSPIATAHLIGLSLSKRSGLPWIADFRDAMTEPDYPPDPMTWKVHRKLERATVHHCRRAVFTTEPTRQMYAERYPSIPAAHWAVIENGFDEDNFRNAESDLPAAPLGRSGQITLVHSGVLYPQERDPGPFFAALGALRRSGDIDSSKLQVILRATGHDHLFMPMITEHGIGDIVSLKPVIAYQEALQEMLRADGLLLFQGESCNRQVPAKIYEYYRSGRPILGLVDPGGISARMLADANVEDVANIADAGDLAGALQTFVSKLSGGRCSGVSPEHAMACSRKSRTKELAALLDGL